MHFCSVLFCSVLFCSVLFCSVLFCSVLFCSVQSNLVLLSSALVLFCFSCSSTCDSDCSFLRIFYQNSILRFSSLLQYSDHEYHAILAAEYSRSLKTYRIIVLVDCSYHAIQSFEFHLSLPFRELDRSCNDRWFTSSICEPQFHASLHFSRVCHRWIIHKTLAIRTCWR
jgi:hypothetical protein